MQHKHLSSAVRGAMQHKAADSDTDIAMLSEALAGRDAEIKAFATSSNARIAELEQKLARRGGAGGELYSESKSIGDTFIESDEFQTLVKNERGRASLSMKATLTLGSTSGGSLVTADRVQGAVELARRRIRMRDVLSPGKTNSSSVEFIKQTTRTNTAATVAETFPKPEATLGYELATAPVRTIAVTLPASRQVLSDAPMLGSMIDGELQYMLADEEEMQLLAGDGTGSNVLGIIPQSTAFAAPFTVPAPTMIDALLLAIAQNEDADFETDFLALNPLDWRRIQAIKDSQGRYLASGPFTPDQIARLWNTPIVPTKGITAGNFLAGDGQRGAQVFDRWQSRVEVSTEHADFFVRNMVMLLAEERLALAVYKPNAFIYGNFATAITAATAL